MPEYKFPEAFLEVGKDDDRSYTSLRTTRLSDGRLQIDLEKWCIIEIGFWLRVEPGEVLKVGIGLVRCSVGLEKTRTWGKKTATHILEAVMNFEREKPYILPIMSVRLPSLAMPSPLNGSQGAFSANFC
jgi:hypothetical protein